MPKSHDFELTKWLSGLELADSERELIAKALGREKNEAYIRDSQLAQSDYAFKMNELKTTKAEFEQKLADEARYLDELSTWKSDQERSIGQIQADAAKAHGEAAALRSYLVSQGVDPTTLGLTPTPPPATNGSTNANTTQNGGSQQVSNANANVKPTDSVDGRYLTREQGLALARWPVVYDQLNRQHQALFGQPIDGQKLYDELVKSNESPDAVFNRLFNVDARKTELAAEERKQWEERTRAELRTQVLSEVQAGRFTPTSPTGMGSPAISQFGVRGMTNGDNWADEAAQDFMARQQARMSGTPMPGVAPTGT